MRTHRLPHVRLAGSQTHQRHVRDSCTACASGNHFVFRENSMHSVPTRLSWVPWRVADRTACMHTHDGLSAHAWQRMHRRSPSMYAWRGSSVPAGPESTSSTTARRRTASFAFSPHAHNVRGTLCTLDGARTAPWWRPTTARHTFGVSSRSRALFHF